MTCKPLTKAEAKQMQDKYGTSFSRKIELPDYCCPQDVSTRGGDRDCDHDYPPDSKDESDTYVGTA